VYSVWSEALQLIRRKSEAGPPDLAIVLGSGLGEVAESSEILCRLSYRNFQGMPGTSVDGHKGELIVGRLAGRTIWFFSGRFHLYEGYSAS